MRQVNKIVLHCSDSRFGDAGVIDGWHKARGWSGIGYHYVILNGYPDETCLRLHRPQFWRDGEVQTGRPLEQVGAHTKGTNEGSVGICLIGKEQFTAGQFAALLKLLAELRARFPDATVVGHYEAQQPGSPPKSCPNLDMDYLRGLMGKG